MTRNARIAALLASVVVVIVAIVVTLGSADDSQDTGAAAAQATPTGSTPASPDVSATTPTSRPTATPVPGFRVRSGEPVGGVKELTVEKGKLARFTVGSDAPASVHLHGYDVEKAVAPGKPASFNFEADIDGVFEVELENSAVLGLNLKVVR